MARATDVAAYILNKAGPMDAMRLQKLVYYCQAWSLVWDEAPLFKDPIEAWTFGPVVPRLYKQHRGKFMVRRQDIDGDARDLTKAQRETVDAILRTYGRKSAGWLSELTHSEAPWRDARSGLAADARSSREITLAAMSEYYGSLTSSTARPVRGSN